MFPDRLELMARQFPGYLADANKPMSDPMADDIDWLSVVPPMP